MTAHWTPRTSTPTFKAVAVSYGRAGSISREVMRRQRVTQTRVVNHARIDELSTENAA
jgi:hypothetical protein